MKFALRSSGPSVNNLQVCRVLNRLSLLSLVGPSHFTGCIVNELFGEKTFGGGLAGMKRVCDILGPLVCNLKKISASW